MRRVCPKRPSLLVPEVAHFLSKVSLAEASAGHPSLSPLPAAFSIDPLADPLPYVCPATKAAVSVVGLGQVGKAVLAGAELFLRLALVRLKRNAPLLSDR